MLKQTFIESRKFPNQILYFTYFWHNWYSEISRKMSNFDAVLCCTSSLLLLAFGVLGRFGVEVGVLVTSTSIIIIIVILVALLLLEV